MVQVKLLQAVLATTSLLAPVLAHPGEYHAPEDVRSEIARRDAHAEHIARGLANCAGNPSYERLRARTTRRLAKKASQLRSEWGIDQTLPYLQSRDLAALEAWEAEAQDLNLTSKGYKVSTKPAKLFANLKNTSCVLTAELTQGPYWITGEPIRNNVRAKQAGVPVHLEYQFIDTSTCKAVSGLYVNTWQANATGVYSGIVANGNGNYNDKTNINKTFLRGTAPTDSSGVVHFNTIFPGHYEGRATHIHVLAESSGSALANKTYANGVVRHVGQIFFPTALREAVELNSPYTTNTQTVTTNDEDMWAPSEATSTYDPFPEYAYLGSSVSDGLLMWISVGIDTTAAYDPTAAGTWTDHGGVAASGGSGSAPSGSGSAPSGSGSAPTGSGMPTGGMPTGSRPTGSMPSGGAPSGSGQPSRSGSAATTSSTSAKSSSSAKSSTTTKAKTTATSKSTTKSSTTTKSS